MCGCEGVGCILKLNAQERDNHGWMRNNIFVSENMFNYVSNSSANITIETRIDAHRAHNCLSFKLNKLY